MAGAALSAGAAAANARKFLRFMMFVSLRHRNTGCHSVGLLYVWAAAFATLPQPHSEGFSGGIQRRIQLGMLPAGLITQPREFRACFPQIRIDALQVTKVEGQRPEDLLKAESRKRFYNSFGGLATQEGVDN